MYYLGLLGGGLALLYPTEALNKTIENPEYLDMIRFFICRSMDVQQQN